MMPPIKQSTNKICYMILPEGIKGDLYDGLKGLSEKYGVSIVVIEDVNWNDDMTPWPAIGVFKKAKPFGGRAASFLNKLANEIIPNTERELGIENTERTLLGVSLSGLGGFQYRCVRQHHQYFRFAVVRWLHRVDEGANTIISVEKGLHAVGRKGEERQGQTDGDSGGEDPCRS